MISDSVVFMRAGVSTFLLFALLLGPGSNAWAQSRRVPAEWEPQEALWLQWPGPFEQTYVTAYAKITNVVAQYQPIRILHHNNAIKTQARNAIAAAGGQILVKRVRPDGGGKIGAAEFAADQNFGIGTRFATPA